VGARLGTSLRTAERRVVVVVSWEQTPTQTQWPTRCRASLTASARFPGPRSRRRRSQWRGSGNTGDSRAIRGGRSRPGHHSRCRGPSVCAPPALPTRTSAGSFSWAQSVVRCSAPTIERRASARVTSRARSAGSGSLHPTLLTRRASTRASSHRRVAPGPSCLLCRRRDIALSRDFAPMAPGGVEPPHADSKMSQASRPISFCLYIATFQPRETCPILAYLGPSCCPGVAPVGRSGAAESIPDVACLSQYGSGSVPRRISDPHRA
jgi:hypothetical protein